MRAEQERQKVLALAAEDHATVRERILLLQETVRLFRSTLLLILDYSTSICHIVIIEVSLQIADLEKNLDRTRREAALRAEKDDAALKTTTEDLRACREQFEEFK